MTRSQIANLPFPHFRVEYNLTSRTVEALAERVAHNDVSPEARVENVVALFIAAHELSSRSALPLSRWESGYGKGGSYGWRSRWSYYSSSMTGVTTSGFVCVAIDACAGKSVTINDGRADRKTIWWGGVICLPLLQLQHLWQLVHYLRCFLWCALPTLPRQILANTRGLRD